MSIESNNIKALIDANVKQNGNNEITGQVMNAVLTAMNAASLKGYHFQGILSADTTLPNNSPYFYIVVGPLSYNAWTWVDGEVGYLAYTNEVGATPQRGTIARIDLLIDEHNEDPTAHQFILDEIDAIDDKIPAEASSSNKLADKDFVTTGFKPKQTAKADPTASGTTITVIDTITQDADGVITATKKTIQDSSTSQKGVVQLSNSYNGTSETKATTEKALSDGLATKANDADVVHKTGAETVSGVKNFSNGLQVSGQLLWYDTTNQCMRITFN